MTQGELEKKSTYQPTLIPPPPPPVTRNKKLGGGTGSARGGGGREQCPTKKKSDVKVFAIRRKWTFSVLHLNVSRLHVCPSCFVKYYLLIIITKSGINQKPPGKFIECKVWKALLNSVTANERYISLFVFCFCKIRQCINYLLWIHTKEKENENKNGSVFMI